jgi:hypothetical protein
LLEDPTNARAKFKKEEEEKKRCVHGELYTPSIPL